MDTITLTEEQNAAVELAVANVEAGVPMTTIGGPAGSGKSTLLNEIKRRCQVDIGISLLPCAYTGKAVQVLRAKGHSEARTIHSTIYKMNIDSEETGKLKADGSAEFRDKGVFWKIEPEELQTQGFLVDEASMISKELLDDLRAFGLPIVFVGDNAQLPPISKNDVNLMENLDVGLQYVHRQGDESGILALATAVRTEVQTLGNTLASFPVEEDGDVFLGSKNEMKSKSLEPDIYICGFNKTRAYLNNLVRRRKGTADGPLIAEGERIIVHANDRKLGVFNGQMGTVLGIIGTSKARLYPKHEDAFEVTRWRCSVLFDGEFEARETEISDFGFNGTKIGWGAGGGHYNRAVIADYGYAITCHKAQGSEWDSVVVINESAPKLWDQSRWLYTAITRASKTLALGY